MRIGKSRLFHCITHIITHCHCCYCPTTTLHNFPLLLLLLLYCHLHEIPHCHCFYNSAASFTKYSTETVLTALLPISHKFLLLLLLLPTSHNFALLLLLLLYCQHHEISHCHSFYNSTASFTKYFTETVLTALLPTSHNFLLLLLLLPTSQNFLLLLLLLLYCQILEISHCYFYYLINPSYYFTVTVT